VSSTNPLRLAVIDDDSGFLTVLGKRVEALEWQQRVVASAIPPEELVAMKLNALLLDPDVLEDSWDYIERVCGMLTELSVIVCTGRSTVAQRVRGLRLGVDDWIAKPCHPEEVIARIEAVTRRHRQAAAPRLDVGPLVAGELEIRPDRFQVLVGGEYLDLTRREFELLRLLAEAHGTVLERGAIYQRIWGYAMAHGDRSVDVFVRKLRHKLEQRSPGWKYIHTHVGVGYRFEPEPAVPAAEERRSTDEPDEHSQSLHSTFTTA
jgi:DNA-binding response OmpR family regulator